MFDDREQSWILVPDYVKNRSGKGYTKPSAQKTDDKVTTSRKCPGDVDPHGNIETEPSKAKGSFEILRI